MRDKPNIHPLLIRGAQLTDNVWIWTLKSHPHKVVGGRRDFEVRVYHHPVEGRDPYLITLVSKEGWVMDATPSPTAAAADAAALDMLSGLTDPGPNTRRPNPTSEAAQMFKAHADRVEHLTRQLIATIEASGANYAQAKHALTRALGALLGANAETADARDAAVSVVARAIAGCAESAPLMTKYGHQLQSRRSRLN
jgi:hypothetical protein